jgi:hypothetical protein
MKEDSEYESQRIEKRSQIRTVRGIVILLLTLMNVETCYLYYYNVSDGFTLPILDPLLIGVIAPLIILGVISGFWEILAGFSIKKNSRQKFVVSFVLTEITEILTMWLILTFPYILEIVNGLLIVPYVFQFILCQILVVLETKYFQSNSNN